VPDGSVELLFCLWVMVVGVGNSPPPITLVAGTHSACWNASPFRIKPCLGQFAKYGSEHCVINDGCNVLQDDESRSYHANDSDEFVKEARPCAFLDAGLLAGSADVLARESTANNVG
jgi:hypothetical protein